MDNDSTFMKEALGLAEDSVRELEVPVGAVIVLGGKIIAKGRNKRESSKNALAHAEIEAINEACNTLGSWRLIGCTIYVTLEPCPMCMGAIINSRIDRVVFGAYDCKAGACGSVLNLAEYKLNHTPKIEGGVMGDECGEMLSRFFRELRKARGV